MKVSRFAKQARFFHIVGGACFGSQYARWLLRARSLGMLQLERIFAVDRDPDCRLLREGPHDAAISVVCSDWVDYLTRLLLNQATPETVAADHWVPSPLSPHILFLAMTRAAAELIPGLRWESAAITEPVGVPVQIPLAGGNLAVSFAEWQCPVNCIEPPTCPAIRGPRTWDMKATLEKHFSAERAFRSSHVLQCRHFVHGVGTIPMQDILTEFARLLENLKSSPVQEFAVATVSGCHGLIDVAHCRRL
ncbi:MAG TPA: hypothetical protein DF383_12655 [Deltaproteobacteria bacterium]|nr:hypothetical protein [Deltaproteobacteria bacterium]